MVVFHKLSSGVSSVSCWLTFFSVFLQGKCCHVMVLVLMCACFDVVLQIIVLEGLTFPFDCVTIDMLYFLLVKHANCYHQVNVRPLIVYFLVSFVKTCTRLVGSDWPKLMLNCFALCCCVIACVFTVLCNNAEQSCFVGVDLVMSNI